MNYRRPATVRWQSKADVLIRVPPWMLPANEIGLDARPAGEDLNGRASIVNGHGLWRELATLTFVDGDLQLAASPKVKWAVCLLAGDKLRVSWILKINWQAEFGYNQRLGRLRGRFDKCRAYGTVGSNRQPSC